MLHLFNCYLVVCFPQDHSLITGPYPLTDSVVKGSVKGVNSAWLASNGSGTLGAKTTNTNGMYNFDVVTSDLGQFSSGRYNQFEENYMGNSEGFDNRYLTQDSTYLHNWQTNGLYLNKVMVIKSHSITKNDSGLGR